MVRSGEIEFGEFCQLCATFLVEDPDLETMKKELKDAFRLIVFFNFEFLERLTAHPSLQKIKLAKILIQCLNTPVNIVLH